MTKINNLYCPRFVFKHPKIWQSEIEISIGTDEREDVLAYAYVYMYIRVVPKKNYHHKGQMKEFFPLISDLLLFFS